MKNNYFVSLLALFATSLLLPSSAAYAENWADKVTLKGFMSFAYHKTNETAFYDGEPDEGGIDNKGSVKGTKLGINLTAKINDRITLASQLFGTAAESYAVHVDWAFIALNLADPLTLRVGKVKYPVGLVNEYRDVGFAYPWIDTPSSIYSLEAPNGPQATRESFSGASLLWEQASGDMTYSADVYAGEVNLSGSDVRELKGLTVKADWDDKVLFQASKYRGIMANVAAPLTAMNGQPHEATVFGVKVDWNNYIVYAETSEVTMGTMIAMKSDSSYATLGYRVGKLLPHVTLEKYKQGNVDDDQTITKLGLRYDIFPDTALKFEIGTIKTDKGQGLFDGVPSKSSVDIYGFSVDVVF